MNDFRKKACVTGYGAIGPVHANALIKCDRADFYALCENDPERAEKCREKYPDVVIYSDFDEMLSDNNIDAVHICTPHHLHVPMAKKALLAGKKVVLEKPAAMNEAELSELLSVPGAEDICVMLQCRTNNCTQKLKSIIKNDPSIGRLTGICAFLTWNRTPEYYMHDSWRGKWATEGGGLLINQAIHTIDLMDQFGGITAVRASVSTKKLSSVIETEDTADAHFSLKNGADALFFGANTFSSNPPPRIEVCFENALFRYADEKLYKISENGIEVIENDKRADIGKKYWGSGHLSVINSFYASLTGEDTPYIRLKDALHSAKIIYAMYESAKNNSKEIIIDQI